MKISVTLSVNYKGLHSYHITSEDGNIFFFDRIVTLIPSDQHIPQKFIITKKGTFQDYDMIPTRIFRLAVMETLSQIRQRHEQ